MSRVAQRECLRSCGDPPQLLEGENARLKKWSSPLWPDTVVMRPGCWW